LRRTRRLNYFSFVVVVNCAARVVDIHICLLVVLVRVVSAAAASGFRSTQRRR
jgi:hypothetical protein